MRKIDTPFHPDHPLDPRAAQFEHWRQSRAHPHDRIPERRWDQAAALPQTLSPSRVAQHLRWRGRALKTPLPQRQRQPGRPRLGPADVIEGSKSSPPPPGPGSLEGEWHRPDGARLRQAVPDAPPLP
jgi:hypothetical protein